jgi:drug/metabolite transporter (DMT)-like permease
MLLIWNQIKKSGDSFTEYFSNTFAAMIFLLLSILSSVGIAVIFKLMDKQKAALLPVIVLNYFTALVAGLLLFNGELSVGYILSSDWRYMAVLIGSLLIIGFYLIGYTTQKAGIAITTIANKMSVIIPILFSILYFSESMSWLKSLGILLALASVLLAVYKKKTGASQKFSVLPIIMFLVIGVIDSAVKLAQHSYVSEEDVSLFSSMSFGLAGIIGIIILSFQNKHWKSFANPLVWIFGILIGLANFGSMYFLILSLNKSGLDSSIVYGVNNMGIILISIAIAVLFFTEKLSKINIIGFILAIISVAILTVLV